MTGKSADERSLVLAECAHMFKDAMYKDCGRFDGDRLWLGNLGIPGQTRQNLPDLGPAAPRRVCQPCLQDCRFVLSGPIQPSMCVSAVLDSHMRAIYTPQMRASHSDSTAGYRVEGERQVRVGPADQDGVDHRRVVRRPCPAHPALSRRPTKSLIKVAVNSCSSALRCRRIGNPCTCGDGCACIGAPEAVDFAGLTPRNGLPTMPLPLGR